MSSKNQTIANAPLNCEDCNEPIIKTAGGEFVCTACGHVSTAKPVR